VNLHCSTGGDIDFCNNDSVITSYLLLPLFMQLGEKESLQEDERQFIRQKD